MPKFSHLIKNTTKLKNSHAAKSAKVEIRRRVLEALGKGAAVFDAFAGAGEMHKAIWHRAAHYEGCDLDWYRDGRLCFVADNRRVLRSIDLAPFRIFDLDAHGSPWEQAIILAARRPVQPGETIGIVLTEGSGLKMKQGGLPRGLALMAGTQLKIAGTGRLAGEIIDRAIHNLAERMGCEITHRWEAKGKTGAAVRYIGLVLVGRKQKRGRRRKPATPERPEETVTAAVS